MGCESCLERKNTSSKKHSRPHSLSLSPLPSLTHTHSRKFKMHTLEHSRTISRKSDSEVPDLPPVFSVLVSGVTRSSRTTDQREIMHSRLLIMKRSVGLVIRRRCPEKSQEHKATLHKSIRLVFMKT